MKIKNTVLKIINFLIPKRKNAFYCAIMDNTIAYKNDIINCSASNLFSILNAMLLIKHEHKLYFYINNYDESRICKYIKYLNKYNNSNIFIVFIKRPKINKKIADLFFKLKCLLVEFSCTFWMIESGDLNTSFKLKSQKIICCNYFISCKNDDIEAKPTKSWQTIDYCIVTSYMDAHIVSSVKGLYLRNCKVVGFPRNDYIINNNKEIIIKNYLIDTFGLIPKKLILYAPTVRDYEHKNRYNKRPLFGYDMLCLGNLLKKYDGVIIYKIHYFQDDIIITNNNRSDRIAKYIDNYSFTFYDLMKYSDCLITDYSSIGYDYLLHNKPIIYNLYDYEKYIFDRGVSFDPYDSFCPGEITKSEKTLIKAILNVLEGKDIEKNKRVELTRIFHKYNDSNSTNRCIGLIDKLIK